MGVERASGQVPNQMKWPLVALVSVVIALIPAGLILYISKSSVNQFVHHDEPLDLSDYAQSATAPTDHLSAIVDSLDDSRMQKMVTARCSAHRAEPAVALQCVNSMLRGLGHPEVTVPEFVPNPVANITLDNDTPGVYTLFFNNVTELIIYVFLVSMQAMALFELFRRWLGAEFCFKHLHGWLIDSPPILGICGTLFALISYIGSSSEFDNLGGFLLAFAAAAATTLAGGFTAVLNQGVLAVASSERE